MKMKHTGFLGIALLVGSLSSLIACQKSSDSGSGTAATPAPAPYQQYYAPPQGYAATPQPCNYMNGANPAYPSYQNGYNCGMYQNYYPNFYNNGYSNINWYQGPWYWPQQYAPTTGYCGCPSGYTPVYGSTFGVSCAPNATFNNFSVTWINIGYSSGQAQNSYWLNNPQVLYNGQGAGSACGQVAQGCDVRINNCSAGYTCRPVAGGSTIGLCAL